MDKKFSLLHYSKYKLYSRFNKTTFINVNSASPGFWKLRGKKYEVLELYPDKEVLDKFKKGKISQIEYELIYKYKLNQLKASGWFDEFINKLLNSDYESIMIMYQSLDISLNAIVLARYIKEKYDFDIEIISSDNSTEKIEI